jgi:hypothetical protein
MCQWLRCEGKADEAQESYRYLLIIARKEFACTIALFAGATVFSGAFGDGLQGLPPAVKDPAMLCGGWAAEVQIGVDAPIIRMGAEEAGVLGVSMGHGERGFEWTW